MRKLSTEELIANKGDHKKLRDAPRNEVYLILEDIRSMYNVGAIFRTADAARVKMLYISGITATPPRAEIEKTALRTTDPEAGGVPWEQVKNLKSKIQILKKQGVQIIALEQTNKSVDFHKFSYKKPLAIIVGNEVDGIAEETLKLCDAAVEIPMQGISNSLNVATAAGIILFEAIE